MGRKLESIPHLYKLGKGKGHGIYLPLNQVEKGMEIGIYPPMIQDGEGKDLGICPH